MGLRAYLVCTSWPVDAVQCILHPSAHPAGLPHYEALYLGNRHRLHLLHPIKGQRPVKEACPVECTCEMSA